MAIPSVIVNVNQQEYKTGLKKAVSALNSAITTSIALEGEGPGDIYAPNYSHIELSAYLQRHMSVMKSTTKLPFSPWGNAAFYTTDGMRYEVPQLNGYSTGMKSHLSGQGAVNIGNGFEGNRSMYGCGDVGFVENSESTAPPCGIIVDVNGDKKPNPANIKANNNVYTYANANDKLLKDVFPILIMNNKAIPYGVAAQKAMYQADRAK